MTYNRQEVGLRLRSRRKEMGVTGEEIGRRIGKSGRYYRDIERGTCGMSLETLILLSAIMSLSLDYLIYGVTTGEEDKKAGEQDEVSILLSRCSKQVRKGAVSLLKAYLEMMTD